MRPLSTAGDTAANGLISALLSPQMSSGTLRLDRAFHAFEVQRQRTRVDEDGKLLSPILAGRPVEIVEDHALSKDSWSEPL